MVNRFPTRLLFSLPALKLTRNLILRVHYMKAEFLDRVNRLATDNVSSAQQIVKDALGLLYDYCTVEFASPDFAKELASLCSSVSNSQSQMAALSNVCKLVTAGVSSMDAAHAAKYIDDLRASVNRAPTDAAKLAAELINDGKSYATLSQSEFVLSAFGAAAENGKFVRVFVMESRPLFEGRQTARSLKRMGHRPTLIADASVGCFIEEIDSAFVGADAILADGTLVNKIGSYPLATLCAAGKKDFYAVTSVLRCDPVKKPADFVNKEESSHEIFANPEFEIKNLYFDKIAPHLITGFITEAGVFSPISGLEQLKAAMHDRYR